MPSHREGERPQDWPQTDEAIRAAVNDNTLIERLVSAVASGKTLDVTYLPHLRAVLDATMADLWPDKNLPLPYSLKILYDKFAACHRVVRDLDIERRRRDGLPIL